MKTINYLCSKPTYTNEFDELNRLIEQDGVWGTTLTFGWDAADRRTSVTDNFHGVVSSVYDDVNRLTRRTLSNETGYSGINPIRVDLAYNDRDLTSITRYASLTTSNKVGSSVFTFDDAKRLTALKHKNASDTIFADYGWSFDAADRITQELLNSVAKNFTYDDTNQLLTATGEDPYAWDANGNSTLVGWETGDNNQLLVHPDFSLEHDGEGNVVAKLPDWCTDKWTYEYDHLNRLVRAKYLTSTDVLLMEVVFVYDVLGNRVEKKVDSDGDGDWDSTLRTAYLDGNPWADFDASNNLLVRYVSFDGLGATVARQSAFGTTAWYLTDNQDSVEFIVNNIGTVIDQITYGSFGNIISETNPSNGDRFKWAGLQWIPDVQLHFSITRPYDPAAAQWIGEDWIKFRAGDTNLRRYNENSPTNSSDPLGLSPLSKGGKIAARKALKKILEKIIREQIKDRLSNLAGKQGAKGLLKEADDLLSILDDSWLEFAVGLIPVAGDAFDAGNLTGKARKLYKRIDELKDKTARYVKAMADCKKNAGKTRQLQEPEKADEWHKLGLRRTPYLGGTSP